MSDKVAQVHVAQDVEGAAQAVLTDQGDAQLLDDTAAGTVGADQVAATNSEGLLGQSVQQGGRDPLRVLHERFQLGAESHLRAEARSLGHQDGLQFGLG